ncbi:MAG: cyclic nucleotide-binding domain-containing protein [Acidobacteria bacterium]|nr:cyclic nucleotide-binding domain-containing protein [Acidobacteriota bacterium]
MAKLRVGGTAKHGIDDLARRFESGTVIFRDGDPGREMYIIQSGSVRISRAVNGEERELAVLEKGDFFGEMAILEDYPERSATASAITDVEVLRLSSADLDEMLQRRPWIAVRMMAKLSERLREANRRVEELAGAKAEAATLPPAVGSQGVEARTLLYHEASHRVFGLKPSGDTTLGRHDPVTGVTPDIDLTALDPDRTISRRHATIRSLDGTLTVTESNASTNGTFVNAVKLEPFQPCPLAHGDMLQLALVTLRVYVLAGG